MRPISNSIIIGALLTGVLAIVLNKSKNGEPDQEVVILTSSMTPLDAGFVTCQIRGAFDFSEKDPSEPIAPLFDNLGDHHFPITTKVPEAQTYFDQGIRLLYAFNHAEAHRSFRETARLDPQCAMAFWGLAIALGPNINDPLPDAERTTQAYEAATKAKELAGKVSKKEKALIEALQSRQQQDPEADRQQLNEAYMASMAPLAEKYADDQEIQTLYAAAVMNTMPWNYWTNQGEPNPGTLSAKAALEKAMELNPEHPERIIITFTW